ncbi:phage portal protein [Streptomyces zhihengii]|uniref:Phage portal protein n=1 Tax=Streptomyces zhihengii TaxID=1818004 RepID=A0ABS2V546_9ACTN|nr:phage portal protein [Streptomyces zhihengii]MBM9624453.1 phage portal protein [Streptomyces zhihengii]
MAYETLSSTAKNEILSAFGVYESVIGNASERTFNNADREEWNFWDHTELPHLRLFASAFDPDLSDDWQIRFNTAGVQALAFPRRQAREEARTEFEAGLITLDEYRKVAGRRPFNTPQSRALWISPQKAPIPANDADAKALGLAPDPGAGNGLGAGSDPALPARDDSAAAAAAVAQALDGGPTAADDVALARGQAPLELPAAAAPSSPAAADVAQALAQNTGLSVPGDAADDVARARTASGAPGRGPAADDVDAARTRIETKALTAPAEGFEVTDADFDAVALAVRAALAALLARQAGVIVARLRAPKTRKHTRFWTPENEHDTRGGDADIDEDRVVSAARWEEETTTTLAPISSGRTCRPRAPGVLRSGRRGCRLSRQPRMAAAFAARTAWISGPPASAPGEGQMFRDSASRGVCLHCSIPGLVR